MWQAGSLWDYLEDKVVGEYHWIKEERDFANCYVCYYANKEIGLIPIVYDESDHEWHNWWGAAYKRHPEGLTLNTLIEEIITRHKNHRSQGGNNE